MTDNTFIKVCLEDEVKYAEGLLNLLSAERDALSQNNSGELEKLADQKRELAEQLETSAGRRNDYLLDTVGMETSDMPAYIEASQGQQIKVLWEQLLDLLGKCREQNRINGSILESSQRSIKQAIALLQGQGQAGELYGRAGKTVSSAAGHSLTHA